MREDELARMELEDRKDRLRIATENQEAREAALRQDMAEAHAEGMHADLPREGCPECEL